MHNTHLFTCCGKQNFTDTPPPDIISWLFNHTLTQEISYEGKFADVIKIPGQLTIKCRYCIGGLIQTDKPSEVRGCWPGATIESKRIEVPKEL